jgi:hypothetical protein
MRGNLRGGYVELPQEENPFGKYIIEVVIGEPRTGLDFEYPGFIQFWLRSGSKPGVQDEKLYMHVRPQCKGLLSQEHLFLKMCPHCGFPMDDEVGELQFFHAGLNEVAEKIAGYVRGLQNDADIRLLRSKARLIDQMVIQDQRGDLREKIAAELRVRAEQEAAIYTKQRMLKDLLSGDVDMTTRIRAFLGA